MVLATVTGRFSLLPSNVSNSSSWNFGSPSWARADKFLCTFRRCRTDFPDLAPQRLTINGDLSGELPQTNSTRKPGHDLEVYVRSVIAVVHPKCLPRKSPFAASAAKSRHPIGPAFDRIETEELAETLFR